MPGGISHANYGVDSRQSDPTKSIAEVAAPLSIAVLSDSISARDALWGSMWPQQLEAILNANGANVGVQTFAVNADSYFRANTVRAFGGQTSVQATIAANPDIVIVMMGYNDAISKVDGRSVTQIRADALQTYITLRNALPKAVIVYSAQLAYDATNFTPATLKNKGIAPQDWTLLSAGILTGLYTPIVLETDVSAGEKQNYTDWVSLDTYVRTLPQIDAAITVNGWRIARLGLCGTDGLHMTQFGQNMIAAYVLKGLLSSPKVNSKLAYVVDQLIPSWIDPDALFFEYLIPSGDGYVTTTPLVTSAEAVTSNWGPQRYIRPDVWFHPYKAMFQIKPTTLTNTSTVTGMFFWTLIGARPLTAVLLSIDGGAFFPVGVVTDALGNAHETGFAGPIGLSLGAHSFIFAVGPSAFGPFSITIT